MVQAKVPLHRFIPACAGNSPPGRANSGPAPVHPRVCGELLSGRAALSGRAGSSPRVRGTLCRYCHRSPRTRFIPACAGNSCRRSAPPGRTPVHPRVCGELPSNRRTGSPATGSSPRVRGTPHAQGGDGSDRRFIPACAGNSATASGLTRRISGSSPRVRGTPARANRGRSASRFIPACAGNSRPAALSHRDNAVHPRVCGELENQRLREQNRVRFIPACAGNSRSGLRSRWVSSGSSPRVRGTLRGHHRAALGRRFIPACAGNSAPNEFAPDHPPVHPRVCGELSTTLVR